MNAIIKQEKDFIEKSYSKESDIVKEVSLNLGGLKIKRELNTVFLPLFYLSKGPAPIEVTYNITFGKRSEGKIKVRGSGTLKIPTEFDYKVFLAILTVKAKLDDLNKSKNIKSNIIRFSINDILKILKLSNGGTNYKAIRDSISKLKGTNYIFNHVLYKKTGIDSDEEEEGFFKNTKPKEVRVGMNEKDNSEVIIERIKEISILKSVDGELIYNKEGELTSNEFILELDDFFTKNIERKYFKFYDPDKLLNLKSGTLTRFYEVIELMRYEKEVFSYKYDTLSQTIPLTSKRRNKTLIKKYAQSLLEKGYIKDYVAEDEFITIRFFSTEKVNFKEKDIPEVSITEEGTLYEENVKSFQFPKNEVKEQLGIDFETKNIHNNVLLDGIKQRIKQYPKYNKEYIINDILEIVNNSGLENEICLSNLDYSINQNPENLPGYFRRAIKTDFTKETRKKKEEKIKNFEHKKAAELEELKQEEEKKIKKEHQEKQFQEYLKNFSEKEIEEQIKKYKIDPTLSFKAKLMHLKMTLLREKIILCK